MVTPIGYAIVAALLPLQLLGAVILLRLFRRHRDFYKSAHTSDGVVTRIVKYDSSEGPGYVYTYSYRVGAQAYTTGEELATKWFRPRKGQPITIYYAPTVPEQGRPARPSWGVICLG